MRTFTTHLVAAPLVAALVLLGGCTTDGIGVKQGVGTLGGAAAGGLAGAQFGKGNGQLAATAGGVLLGALLGNEIGTSLDRADQVYAARAANSAFSAPIGSPIRWSNPESGNMGTITTTREGRAASGAYCREYQQNVYVGGRTVPAQGTACQQPDGSWKIVN